MFSMQQEVQLQGWTQATYYFRMWKRTSICVLCPQLFLQKQKEEQFECTFICNAWHQPKDDEFKLT